MRKAKRSGAFLVLFGAVASLAGCASGGGPADGTWVGRLRTVAGTCPDTEDSDLDVSGHGVVFVPGDGVIALHGALDPADPARIRAQHAGTVVDRKPYPMVLEASYRPDPNGGAVDGTYGTPECRATIRLHRPTDTGLRRLLGG